MPIQSLHHVAYRCKDAQETVDFYTNVMGLEFSMAMAEDRVPSTREESPYMHVFFKMADGSHVAFFEVPESPPMGRDTNTPEWVQHLALKVDSEAALLDYKARAEARGMKVIGPVDHTIFRSIYFHDPSGHRLELTADVGKPEQLAELARAREPMMQEWNRTKRPPRQAAWVHSKLA